MVVCEALTFLLDNIYVKVGNNGLISQIYPLGLQLNKVNSPETEALFFGYALSILYGFISSKIYDKRDDFDFEIVNFPYLDGVFLVDHPTVFIYRNNFGSPECLVMLLT